MWCYHHNGMYVCINGMNVWTSGDATPSSGRELILLRMSSDGTNKCPSFNPFFFCTLSSLLHRNITTLLVILVTYFNREKFQPVNGNHPKRTLK